MPRLCKSAVALVAFTSIAPAQPAPLQPAQSESRPASEGPRIPITLQPGGEVLDAEGAGRERVPPVPAVSPVSVEHPIDPETYVCGPGDVFELDFWGSQNLRLTLMTDLEGRAFVAKVGFFAVAGKTLAAVRAAMQAKIRAVYPGLHFDLTLASPRTFTVHVVDNVGHPGTYTSRAVDRVSTVLAKAGQTSGSRRRIAIRHRDGATARADLVHYELTGDTGDNPFLLDGDVIRVPFAEPMVTIEGAVRRPGRYELIATKDLAELLELAGGFTSKITRALPLRLLRRNAQQHQTVIELPFTGGATPSAALRDDDTVIVRSSDELQRTVLVLGAVAGADPLDRATTIRRAPFVEGDTVLSLLDRIGGIQAPGDLQRSYISRPRPGADPELVPLDLEALLVRRELSADRPIHLGDTVVVPPVQYSVLVEGAVGHAGLYPYNPTFGITEYIAHAGGRARTAREIDEVQLIDTSGHTHPFRPGMKPSPGDAILVPERNFSRSEVAQLILAGVGLALSGIAVTIAATR